MEHCVICYGQTQQTKEEMDLDHLHEGPATAGERT